MFTNNIKAFICHAFLQYLTFFSSFIIGFNSSLKSETELIKHLHYQQVKSWITFIILIILYFIYGRYALKSQGSRLKNIISVSSIIIVGLILGTALHLGYDKLAFIYFTTAGAFTPVFISKNNFLIQIPYMIFFWLLMGFSIKNTKRS